MIQPTRFGIAIIFFVVGCGGPPPLGDDKDSRKAVDALYTAVTAREPRLLDQAERDLQSLKDAGKLPELAFRALEKAIAKARAGKWQSAAEDLTAFITGQRRGSR